MHMMMVHMAMVVLWATSNIETQVYAGGKICQYIRLCGRSHAGVMCPGPDVALPR